MNMVFHRLHCLFKLFANYRNVGHLIFISNGKVLYPNNNKLCLSSRFKSSYLFDFSPSIPFTHIGVVHMEVAHIQHQ